MDKEEQCRNIYREAFRDPNTRFEDKLFGYCFKYCRTAEMDGEIASIVFTLPCTLKTHDKTYDAFYIFAAATLKKYRGMGIMSRLIKSVENDTQRVLFLKPADDGLIDYYKKLGFAPFSASASEKNICCAVPELEFDKLIETETEDSSLNSYTAMYFYKQDLNLDGLYFPYVME